MNFKTKIMEFKKALKPTLLVISISILLGIFFMEMPKTTANIHNMSLKDLSPLIVNSIIFLLFGWMLIAIAKNTNMPIGLKLFSWLFAIPALFFAGVIFGTMIKALCAVS